MSDSDTHTARSGLRTLWMRPTPRYQAKLDQLPVRAELDEAGVEAISSTTAAASADIQTLQTLAERAREDGAVFQSVAVAALQILERVVCCERKAAEAALSLGQREKLQSMVETSERACATLQDTLSVQGAKVKQLCTDANEAALGGDKSWWFVLTEALDILENGAEQMASLTGAQPEGSPAWALSRCIAQLLQEHHDALLLEAEQWIA